jgi:hypothetical protein
MLQLLQVGKMNAKGVKLGGEDIILEGHRDGLQDKCLDPRHRRKQKKMVKCEGKKKEERGDGK